METIRRIETVGAPDDKIFWLKFTVILDSATDKWEYNVRPDIPTVENILGILPSIDHVAIAERIASARHISRSDYSGSKRRLTVWTKRPILDELSHPGDGVIIDGEPI